MHNPGKTFRELLRTEPYLFTGGVYSPLDAQIAERVGMKSIYLSGYSMALANGWPDMGFLTQTEVARIGAHGRQRRGDSRSSPMPTTAMATRSRPSAPCRSTCAERRGRFHIEDQVFPKRCGHIAGKTIIPLDQAVGKYRAAIDTRDRLNPDFVIIARTDAFGAVGGSLEETIRRGRAYADAGVDLVWPELSSARREPAVAFAKAMRESHPNTPLAFNYSSSFKWHKDPNPFTFAELGELNYKFIFITLFAAHAGMYAVWNAMEELVKDQEQAQWRLEKTKVGHPTESHHVMARVSAVPGAGEALHPGERRAHQGFGGVRRQADALRVGPRPARRDRLGHGPRPVDPIDSQTGRRRPPRALPVDLRDAGPIDRFAGGLDVLHVHVGILGPHGAVRPPRHAAHHPPVRQSLVHEGEDGLAVNRGGRSSSIPRRTR